MIDAITGGSVLFGSSNEDGGAWYVNNSNSRHYPNNTTDKGNQIVALSFDSSSSYLCAVNMNGDVAIFGPLEWGRQSQQHQVMLKSKQQHHGHDESGDKQQQQQQPHGFFASFTGGGGKSVSSRTEEEEGLPCPACTFYNNTSSSNCGVCNYQLVLI